MPNNYLYLLAYSLSSWATQLRERLAISWLLSTHLTGELPASPFTCTAKTLFIYSQSEAHVSLCALLCSSIILLCCVYGAILDFIQALIFILRYLAIILQACRFMQLMQGRSSSLPRPLRSWLRHRRSPSGFWGKHGLRSQPALVR